MTGPRRRVTRALALAAALAGLAGCGLPAEPGVHSARPVAPEAVERGAIQVLPPGPQPDAGPREVVIGFLEAQRSADDRHALARGFLAPEVRESWDDRNGVVVYDPASVDVVVDAVDEQRVVVRAQRVATIAEDGAYLLGGGPTEDQYRLKRDEAGQLRLVDVPSGLRLTPAGTNRSFEPYEIFFLSPPDGPRPTAQLVPDRVFLPVGEQAQGLVQRLLAGPSSALRDAVHNAFPPGTELRRPVTTADGVVTVDLTGDGLRTADAARRRQLSAQLVWTLQTALPAPPKVRLLVDGEPLDVPDAPRLQDRSDWRAFDPVGAAGRTAALYVQERRVQRLDGTATRSEATDGRLPVDAVTSSPSTGRLALLTRAAAADGRDVVRVGPPAGPFTPLLEVPAVRSMSWGNGERGLWVVAAGAGAGVDGRVVLVPSTSGARPVDVPYAQPSDAGPLSVLRVSRDGARVAAVFGRGSDRRLYVGRVEQGDAGLRLAGLRAVAPGLADVADVAWESGTSLVVLAPLGTPNRLLVRVSVDGSELEPVRTLGLDGEPETVAAAPGRPLVVGAVLSGRPVLLVEDGGLFRLQPGEGQAPSYPG